MKNSKETKRKKTIDEWLGEHMWVIPATLCACLVVTTGIVPNIIYARHCYKVRNDGITIDIGSDTFEALVNSVKERISE